MGRLTAPKIEDVEVEVLAPGILLLRGLLPWAEELSQACTEIDGWSESVEMGPEGPLHRDYRNCTEMMVDPAFDARFGPWERALIDVVGLGLRVYVDYNKYCDARQDQLYRMLRYEPGQHYHEHIDSHPLSFTGGINMREISLSIGCNKSSEYEGGKLVFPLHDLELTLEQGDGLMFPASVHCPHAATDVTKGERRAMVTWFHHGVITKVVEDRRPQ